MSTQIRGNKQIKNITIGNQQITDGSIELNKLKDGSELLKRDGSVVATGDFDLNSNQLKNVGAPVDANDAVRKADLDAAVAGSIINREIPSGTMNGANTQFTLLNQPNLGTEQVFLNGALLNSGANSDYVVDGSTITFTLAPQSGDVILVNYITDAIVVNLDISNTLNQFNSRLTTAESELFSAQGDITSLDSNLSGVDGRLTSAEGDITSLEGDVVAVESSVTSLQSSVSTLQSGLSSEQSARIAADSALDTSVSSIQTSMTSLGNRMTAAESDITALEAVDAAMDLRAGVIEDGLQTETSARTSADSALSSRVTTLENAPAPVTSYNNLTDKPSLFSGSYTDLSNKPTLFDGAYESLSGKPSLFSGSYTDLTNKPTFASFTTLTSPVSGQYLKFNGTAWVNSAIAAADLPVANQSAGIVDTGFQIWNGEKRFASTMQANAIASFGTAISISGGQSGTFAGGKLVCGGAATTGYMDFYTKVNGQQFQELKRANISDAGLFSMYYGLSVQPGAAATKGLIVKGAASQTANLFEAQNSSGTELFSIDKDGSVAAGTVPVARVSGLATVATSGSYADLSNKPTLFDGAYASLTGKPTIYTPVKEVPSGSVNGTNVTFTITNPPAVAGTEQVFLNGLLQFAGASDDYTISGGTITFNTAPDAGWKLVVYYFV